MSLRVIQIPHEHLAAPQVVKLRGGNAFRVWVGLHHHDGQRVSQSRLGKELGLGVGAVQAAIRELREAKLLRVEPTVATAGGGTGPNVYQLVAPEMPAPRGRP